MGWWMYQGDTIYGPAVADVRQACSSTASSCPCKQQARGPLKLAKGDHYLQERNAPQTYLMLSDVEHLDVDVERDDETSSTAPRSAPHRALGRDLRPLSNIAESDLKQASAPHVRYYLKLLKSKRVAPLAADQKPRRTPRGRRSRPCRCTKRYYDLFVNSLIDEKYDEGGEDIARQPQVPAHHRSATCSPTAPTCSRSITSARVPEGEALEGGRGAVHREGALHGR